MYIFINIRYWYYLSRSPTSITVTEKSRTRLFLSLKLFFRFPDLRIFTAYIIIVKTLIQMKTFKCLKVLFKFYYVIKISLDKDTRGIKLQIFYRISLNDVPSYSLALLATSFVTKIYRFYALSRPSNVQPIGYYCRISLNWSSNGYFFYSATLKYVTELSLISLTAFVTHSVYYQFLCSMINTDYFTGSILFLFLFYAALLVYFFILKALFNVFNFSVYF